MRNLKVNYNTFFYIWINICNNLCCTYDFFVINSITFYLTWYLILDTFSNSCKIVIITASPQKCYINCWWWLDRRLYQFIFKNCTSDIFPLFLLIRTCILLRGEDILLVIEKHGTARDTNYLHPVMTVAHR